ncbi:hypothetical protein DFJ73DRAFT_775986 [Zopfochytrium polystomum]|nr:hypothetical protein DFJ73DRAFT_775986 [Zopfochytrium polystomum]
MAAQPPPAPNIIETAWASDHTSPTLQPQMATPPPPPPSSAAAAADSAEYVVAIDHDALYSHDFCMWTAVLGLSGCVGLVFLPCVAGCLAAAKSTGERTHTILDSNGVLERRPSDNNPDAYQDLRLDYLGAVVRAPRSPVEVQELIIRRRNAAVLGSVAPGDAADFVAEFYGTTPDEAAQRFTMTDHSLRYVSTSGVDRWIALEKVRDVFVRGHKTPQESGGSDVEIAIGGDEPNVRVVGPRNAQSLREAVLARRDALKMRLAQASDRSA